MANEIEAYLTDLAVHDVTLGEGGLHFGTRPYPDWAVIPGRPHRHEFGSFIRRWVANRATGNALLVTGPSDRPVRPFLEQVGVNWLEIADWSTFERRPQGIWSPSLAKRVPGLGQRGELTADVEAYGRPLLEEDMEIFLDEHPDWLTRVMGEAITSHPAGRQFRIDRGRLDLLATDSRGRTCIIECKRGALHESHIGQIIEYQRPGNQVVHGARLILLVNTSNPAYDEPLASIGIEIRRFPIELLVQGMRREGFEPRTRESRMRRLADDALVAPWKRAFIEGLRAGLPEEVSQRLVFNTAYKPAKKVACHDAESGASVFYVESNGPRLEICLSIIDEVLRSGGTIPFLPRSTHVVYFGKTSTLLTTDIRSDEAADWLTAHGPQVQRGLNRLSAGLESNIQTDVLKHFGAVFQNHNALKGEADGVCRGGANCPYPHT